MHVLTSELAPRAALGGVRRRAVLGKCQDVPHRRGAPRERRPRQRLSRRARVENSTSRSMDSGAAPAAPFRGTRTGRQPGLGGGAFSGAPASSRPQPAEAVTGTGPQAGPVAGRPAPAAVQAAVLRGERAAQPHSLAAGGRIFVPHVRCEIRPEHVLTAPQSGMRGAAVF